MLGGGGVCCACGLFLMLFILAGCEKPLVGWNKYVHSDDALDAQKSITAGQLRQHISTLASDQFEGRFPGTVGEELTVEYLSQTYEKLGLKPGNPDGTWIQKATMTGVISEYKAQFLTDNERWVMKVGVDIVGNSSGFSINNGFNASFIINDADNKYIIDKNWEKIS